ncbi:hypothetical protein [Bifidobacterium olomucense]|uniref:RelA/SpoT domain-containing protein n=1 Tax=Bifidobacterium olomucense TaxID=2675324 RepID=A0A7Y0EXY1_9BIFI|nr:hypothetical protein [Bifidobacterium sp. DSM 109959]NMM98128.1 hypothetical protein [Bifidobacterium sp. DSM 109959]
MDKLILPDKPWTQRQIRDLRKEIIAGGDAIDGLSYVTVRLWYQQVLAKVVAQVGMLDTSGLDIGDMTVAFRVKTVDTLRDKLIREPTLQIPRVRDVMGVRITADMTLDAQTALASRIGGVLPVFKISDMREAPHSGYRAVHVIVKLPDGVFCEVQVRTLLQDAWANCYELAGDIYGRAIRYEGKPDHDDHGVVDSLKNISASVATLEKVLNDSNDNNVKRKAVTASMSSIIEVRDSLEEKRDILKRF